MKYIIKLDRDELLNVMLALQNEADRLNVLSRNFVDAEFAMKLALKAKNLKILYQNIMDTYEPID